MILSRLPYDCRQPPKKDIPIPRRLLRYFSLDEKQLHACFDVRRFRKREQSVYAPKVDGPILAPAMKGNIVQPVVFYIDHGKVAAIEVNSL